MNIDVFVSHHTDSSLHIVEAIVNKLEAKGIRCWYAPRDTKGSYASSITQAINSCRVFLLILNKSASESVHVLNELDLVTKRLSRKEEVSVLPFHVADNDISDDARYYLGRLHWLDATKPSMIERIHELVAKISTMFSEIPGFERNDSVTKEKHVLISKIPQTREVFLGRDELLQSICSFFEGGERILFLEGIGGIGKSEIAKQYAARSQKKYKNIVFVAYTDTLNALVCDQNKIELTGLEKRPNETEADFFARKMNAFRAVASKDTLLIVDNYDVDVDPDFDLFVEGSHHVIFTTRNSHPGFRSIHVKAIDSKEILFDIFEQNYGDVVCEEDRPFLEKLFALVENHTYAIELLAKQMNASFYTGEELYHVFCKGYSTAEHEEQIVGRDGINTAIGHIRSLFSLSNLCDEKKHILRELALTGTGGIPSKLFFEWATPTQSQTIKQHLNQLIHQSWVRCERKATCQQFSLHPLVSEVILSASELKPNIVNCRCYLEKIADRLYFSWNHPISENILYVDAVLSIAEYFAPFAFNQNDQALFEIWVVFSSFLWQVGKFDEAIHYGKITYDNCLKEYGSASMLTGFAARALAGAYFNCQKIEESMPWYRLGLEHMEAESKKESIDLALSYEKVARTYTWKYDRDFKKAEALFKKAIDTRLRLIDAYENGETIARVEHRYHADAETTQKGLPNIYMELGRMHQEMGDYETALHYAGEYLTLLEKYGIVNPSNRAYGLFDQGVCHYHLAMKWKKKGENDIADECLQKSLQLLCESLEINMNMRGAVALDTIDNQEWLGDVYAAMQRYGDAVNCYIAVITMLENIFGSDYARIEAVKIKMDQMRQ